MYEQITSKLVLVDLQGTNLSLGALSGPGVTDITFTDTFFAKGTSDLGGKIGGQIVGSLILQSLVILGTPKLLGNPMQIIRAG